MSLNFKVLEEKERSGYRITLLCEWSDAEHSETFSYSRDYSSKPVEEIQSEIDSAFNEAEALAMEKHARFMAAQS